MATKKTEFDIPGASSEALVDMGGAADTVAKRNAELSSAIKVELRSRMDNLPKDETSTIVAVDYVATIGKVAVKIDVKSISNKEVIELIGQEAFNAIANVSTAILKTALAGADFDKLVTKSDGTRAVSFKEVG